MKEISVIPKKFHFNFQLSIQTHVEVWDGGGRIGGEFYNFVEEVTMQKGQEDLNWWVRWSTKGAGTKKAIYQLSLFPFSQIYSAITAGLVASDYIDKIPVSGKDSFFQLALSVIFSKSSVTKISTGALPKPSIIKPFAIGERPGRMANRKNIKSQLQITSSKKNTPTIKQKHGSVKYLRLLPKKTQGCLISPIT